MSIREFCISVKTDSRDFKKLVKEIEKINNRYSDKIGPVCGLFAALKAKNDLSFAPVLFGVQTESKHLHAGEEIVYVWGERGYLDSIYRKFKSFEVGSGLDELLNSIVDEENQFTNDSAQNEHFLYSKISDNKIVVPFDVQSIQQNSSIDENQDKIVIDETKSFDKQVDNVLNGADTTSSHLEVLKVTPPLLRMVGVPNLPILMTAKHIKTITQESGTDSANYHGLGVELIKRLPELISDPVMIMDSLTKDDSIVVVTQTVDKENRPVIGAIKLNGVGRQDSKIISANILTSAYGKDNFQSFIERNIEQGSVLYVDKEKSQALSVNPGIQFPDVMASLSFNTIIRKTQAFVNTEEEKKSEDTEKNEGSMRADTNNATAQTARERVQQVRDEMVKTLLEHIEKNPTEWQSGWNNIAAGAPYNGKTNTAYRGMNALYLAFLGASRGYKDTRWVTFNQAKELGTSVKKGEKSSPVIFFEFYDRATKKAFDSRTVKDMTEEEKAAYLKENVYAVMKYSSVFNAEQCHNFPERKEIAMSEEERANQNVKIETIIANSAAPVLYDGGSRAYYSLGTDKIHLPAIKAFDTMQDYYATALHEIAHSTGHESRLNRDLAGGFGSESYAKEELRAELACVFMQMEQGIQLNGKHITNHAAYLNSWLEAAKRDTSVFFKAAADAQKIADYVAENYLQAAEGAVIEEENVAQEQNEEQPERNPMAEYLRAEQPTSSAVSDAGERQWEQENIRDWYTSAYPNDEAGLDIHPNATFKDLREEVNRPNPISVYGMLGEDSVVRERTFMRLAELSGSSYASIYSAFIGETAEQKLENARALARRLATETGEPHVTIEWSEHQALSSYDVMSLSEADKKLSALDAQEDKNEGYYKTKLHIDYVFEGDHNAYECCRFDIGSEGGGLVHHIDEFLKYDTYLDAEEREQAETALKYFKVHMDLSSMEDTAISSNLSEQEQFDVQSYVLVARGAVNSAVPFSTYKLPETSAFEQEENIVSQPFLNKTKYGSPVSGIIETESGHRIAIINNNEQKEVAFPDGYPAGYIIAHDYNPNTGEFLTATQGFASHEEAREYLSKEYGFDIGQSLESITEFRNENAFLSNFYSATINYNGQSFLNNEAAFQAMKCPSRSSEFSNLTGVQARALGRQVALRSDWNDVKEKIMLEICRAKFSQHTDLAAKLLQTGERDLIEGNTWRDTEWGVYNGEGQNKLGKILMAVRAELNENHEKKLTVEEARNAMLDAHNKEISHYAIVIENMPYTDPDDGYESEEPAQNVYIISDNGRVELWSTLPVDGYLFTDQLPYGRHRSYEQIEIEELEEIAANMRKSMQSYMDALRAENESAYPDIHRPEMYYEDRAMDVLEEHYTAGGGVFQREIESPKYLSGTKYAEENFRGDKVLSIVKAAQNRNIAIFASRDGRYVVEDDYHTDDGRNWGRRFSFDDQKTAEEFVNKAYDKGEAQSINLASYNSFSESTSEMVRRYAQVKRENPAEIVFYRIGDFYEVLGEDARRAAQELELTLTGRDAGLAERIPMAGVPYHAIDEYAAKLAEKGVDVAIADGAELKHIKGNSPRNMPQTTQNEPMQANTGKREWLNIELPNGAVGGQYGENTMIKMPKGEYSYFAFYVPNRMLKEADGKTQLRVASDYTFRLNNDGRQVELTGKELADSFNGVRLDKPYKRVAPSRRALQVLENIEKNVPDELKALPNWCVYRTWQKKEGKKGKVIKSAVTGEGILKGESGEYNPSDFTDFNTAIKYAKKEGFEGVSLLLDKKSGITCIDLDECILNAETGQMNERATKLVATLGGTYIERSTSGNGLHIFVRDDILKNGQYNTMSKNQDKGDLEVYDDGRIMSITGDMYSRGNKLTRAGSAVTVYLRQELGERRNVSSKGSTPRPTNTMNLSDSELIQWIRNSKVGAKFDDLYSGRGVSGDRSDDDGKLAHMLLYFNGGDKEQAFRIMRESGAYRVDKPDSYYRHTIDKMNGTIEEYAKRPTLSAGGANKPIGRGKRGNGNQA